LAVYVAFPLHADSGQRLAFLADLLLAYIGLEALVMSPKGAIKCGKLTRFNDVYPQLIQFANTRV
jgi:hypothetical protein